MVVLISIKLPIIKSIFGICSGFMFYKDLLTILF